MNRIVRVSTAVAVLTLAACVGDTPQVPEKSCENCGTTCVDLRTDVNHCGKCDTKCGAGEICSASKCVLNCPTGFVACGGKCIDPNTNASNCGAKGACTGTDATAADYAGATCAAIESCVAGKCSGRCPAGRLLCGDGCVDPTSDRAFCGAKDDCAGTNAGTPCPADQFCISGKCSCPTGQIVCGGKCVDPKSNGSYCGAKGDCEGTNAGKECKQGEGCSGGVCGACAANQVLCGTSCIDPKNDREYCGATGDCQGTNAGAKCLSVETCDTGVCKLTCASGQIKCGTKCVDPSTDLGFCGAKDDCAGVNAGAPCTADQYCNAGTCASKVACAAGQLQCGSTCVAPTSDPGYCGAKGKCTGTDPSAADYAGATCAAGEYCNAGACAPVLTCAAGQIRCGSNCVNPATDLGHCGAKGACTGTDSAAADFAGVACAATEFCSAGKCLPLDACPAGQIKCGGKCIDPLTDDEYCGAKGTCTDAAGDAGVSSDSKGQACIGMNRCKAGTCQPLRAASCEELALAATGSYQDYPAKDCAFGANDNWANWAQAQAPCETYCKARGAPAARIEGYGNKPCGSGTCDFISNFETCAIGSIVNGGGCSHCSVGFRCVCRFNADNFYTLYIDNDGAKPYQAYCKDMGTATPKTYLILANTGGNYNFSQKTQAASVRTSYTRLRFDPKTMLVDINDSTFSTTTGTGKMPYAIAADCVGGGSKTGVANVNLVGTPFRAVSTWTPVGASPAGSSTGSVGGQVWDLTGGGYCGWNQPGPIYDLYGTPNDNPYWSLKLEYIAPKATNVYVASETNAVQQLAVGADLQFTTGAKVAVGGAGAVVNLRLNASGKHLYAGGATALRAWALGTDGSLTTPGTTLPLPKGAPPA